MNAHVEEIPSLRFPGSIAPWSRRGLGGICKIKTGKKDVNEGNPKGLYPFFTCARKHTFSDHYSFDTEAILIAGNGDVGHCQRYKGKFEAYQRTYVLSQFKVEVDYLFLYLNFRFRETVDQQKQMGAMPYIKLGMLTNFVVPFPTDATEGKKIADFLTAVDGRIGQLIQKKALLEDYKKGVMQQLFTQAIRFKDDKGNDFPEWVEKKLGEVGKITTGKTPSTSDDAAWVGDTMFVTPSDIGEDTKFQHKTSRHVNGEKLRLIPKNSLMFTCIASVGKMSIATQPCITNQQINSVSVGSGFLFEYVYYALRKLTPKIKSTQANNTLPIINKTEFSKFVLPIPSIPEQTKIANFLSAIDRKIESCATQMTETQTFKRGLLQQMFV
jgi:type I restriction enzyme S subunit